MPADNHVAVPDHGGQDAHGQDDGKRGITGGNKGQANNKGLACSPIAIEQRRGAFPVNVPWEVNAAAIHAAPSSCCHNARFSSKHARWLKQTGAPVKSRVARGAARRGRGTDLSYGTGAADAVPTPVTGKGAADPQARQASSLAVFCSRAF